MSSKNRQSDNQGSPTEQVDADATAPGETVEEGAMRADRTEQGSEAEPAEPADPADQMELDPLEAARKEAAENYDRLLRTRAELENVLKRHARDRIEASKYAAEAIARDLLVVVDDLERALEHADQAQNADSALIEGVNLVLKSLRSILEKHGVTRVDALGQPFDPADHEAVAMVESAEHEPNTVMDEHRAGYRIADRLLRPAMVVVSKAASEPS